MVRNRAAAAGAALLLCAAAAGIPAGGAEPPADGIVVAPAAADSLFPADLEGRPVLEVAVTGTRHTRPGVVKHRLATRAGRPLRLADLRSDRLMLLASGAFTSVAVSVEPRPGGVVVVYALVESSLYSLGPAVNITAEDGLSLGGTLTTPNAEGLLIRGYVGILFGGLQQTHIDVRAPRVRGRYGRFEVVYYNRQRRNSLVDFFEVANEVFVTAAPQVSRHAHAGLRLGYQSMRADRDGATLGGGNVDEVFTLGALAVLDTRDNELLTRRGGRYELLAERTGLLGDTEFWRLTADLRQWLPLGRRFGFSLWGLGTWTAGDLGEEVAPWQLLHVGGASTVRGWAVGSRSGIHQAIATAAARWTFVPPAPVRVPILGRRELALQTVLFADAGTAWSGPADARLDRVIVGPGVGLHVVDTGLGRLRLDLGFGGDSHTLRVHFASGNKADVQRRRVR